MRLIIAALLLVLKLNLALAQWDSAQEDMYRYLASDARKIQVNIGEPVKLECYTRHLSSSPSNSNYKWVKHDLLHWTSQTLTNFTGPVLAIDAADFTHDGLYSCQTFVDGFEQYQFFRVEVSSPGTRYVRILCEYHTSSEPQYIYIRIENDNQEMEIRSRYEQNGKDCIVDVGDQYSSNLISKGLSSFRQESECCRPPAGGNKNQGPWRFFWCGPQKTV